MPNVYDFPDFPRVRLTTYGKQSFVYAGPSAWNSLPDVLTNTSLSLSVFRSKLNSHLFAYYLSIERVRGFLTIMRYINLHSHSQLRANVVRYVSVAAAFTAQCQVSSAAAAAVVSRPHHHPPATPALPVVGPRCPPSSPRLLANLHCLLHDVSAAIRIPRCVFGPRRCLIRVHKVTTKSPADADKPARRV